MNAQDGNPLPSIHHFLILSFIVTVVVVVEVEGIPGIG